MKRRIFRQILTVTLLLVMPVSTGIAASNSPFVIVVSRDGFSDNISPRFGEAAFSMQTTTWPDGHAIQLVVLPSSDPIQYVFTQNVLHLAPYQAETRWLRFVYSGQALKPIVVQNFTQMADTVARIPGAVGYLPVNAPLPAPLQVLP